MHLFKLSTTNNCSKPIRVNNKYGIGEKQRKTKITKQLEEKIIKMEEIFLSQKEKIRQLKT